MNNIISRSWPHNSCRVNHINPFIPEHLSPAAASLYLFIMNTAETISIHIYMHILWNVKSTKRPFFFLLFFFPLVIYYIVQCKWKWLVVNHLKIEFAFFYPSTRRVGFKTSPSALMRVTGARHHSALGQTEPFNGPRGETWERQTSKPRNLISR